ncbi:hypothetical protein VB735_16055 [Halotia wernerae UHCC 0503]|nr:hypothetical protein [Halotia wernerae UHCC 0503]
MQTKGWKNLLLAILLTSSGANICCIRLDAACATSLDQWDSQNKLASTKSLARTHRTHQTSSQGKQKAINSRSRQFYLLDLAYIEQIPLNVTLPKSVVAQSNPAPPTPPNPEPQANESPQLETQPSDFPQSYPKLIEPLLDEPQTDYAQRLEKLRRRLQKKKQPNPKANVLPELGLRVQQVPIPQTPLEQLPLPPVEQPVAKFKPIGFLKARIGYFNTSNIFSSNIDPIEDGLIFYGLSFASAYYPLGSNTYLNGSIDGNLIRYIDQSKYDYNQVRFNLGIYQQLSPRMYGEIGWSNQQLFYANNSDRFDAGDRFLGENSLRLSLGRRDSLTQRLKLDSSYIFSVNFAEPNNRNRIINSLWVSLDYYLQKPLRVGFDYQFNLSDFTQRQRDDNYHRLFGHLNYQISDFSNLSLQSGISFGDSTDSNIDFDGWFFSINYNLELGRF